LIAALGEQTTHLSNVDLATWSFSAPSNRDSGWCDALAGRKAPRCSERKRDLPVLFSGPTRTKVFENAYTRCNAAFAETQPNHSPGRIAWWFQRQSRDSSLHERLMCGGASLKSNARTGSAIPMGTRGRLPLRGRPDARTDVGPSVTNVTGELAMAPAVSAHQRRPPSAPPIPAPACTRRSSASMAVVQAIPLDENGALQECRPESGRTPGLPLRAALPSLIERGCRLRHDESERRQPSLDRERRRRGGKRRRRTRPDDHGHQRRGARHVGAGQRSKRVERSKRIERSDRDERSDRPKRSERVIASYADGALEEPAAPRDSRAPTVALKQSVGRLTGPGGVPIAGARIDLVATPAYAGARPRL